MGEGEREGPPQYREVRVDRLDYLESLQEKVEELESSVAHLRECADGSASRAEQWAANCDARIAERDARHPAKREDVEALIEAVEAPGQCECCVCRVDDPMCPPCERCRVIEAAIARVKESSE